MGVLILSGRRIFLLDVGNNLFEEMGVIILSRRRIFLDEMGVINFFRGDRFFLLDVGNNLFEEMGVIIFVGKMDGNNLQLSGRSFLTRRLKC